MALGGVDLDAHAGEVVAVLGPNGSGKSSLLRLLATASPLQAGSLELLGEPAGPRAALRRRIGFAGDAPVHPGALTARECVALLGRASGLAAADAAARGAAMLERVGLAADAEAPVASVSLGMRRRLMIAETLVHRPGLILLDEPTLGLDPDGLDALARLLAAAVAAGAAAVVASNDVGFAARVATRVTFLRRSLVVGEGTPSALLAQVGAEAVVAVELAAPARRPLRPPPGVRLVEQGEARLTARVPAGAGVLPALLRAVEEAGASVRGVAVREPDLSDVFRALTGETLA